MGSGGSMRLFAKLDRRHRHHPVKKIHGYCISRRALENLVNDLTETGLEVAGADSGDEPGSAPTPSSAARLWLWPSWSTLAPKG